MIPWNFFPFNKEMKEQLQKMNPDQIDQYIQSIMGKVIPSNTNEMVNTDQFMRHFGSQPSQQETALNSAVFETHDCVFIRIPIKDESFLKQLRLYHTANQLVVEHIPEIDDKQSITLPAIVKRKGASAKYKDGILEVRLIKSYDMQYSEIDVSET